MTTNSFEQWEYVMNNWKKEKAQGMGKGK